MTRLENTITACLRWRSTIVPKTIEKIATSSMYAPPMMPVASTDRVSRYTQKVSANHRKLVVTFASAVLTSTWMKVRMPPAAARPRDAVPLPDPPIRCWRARSHPSRPGEVISRGYPGAPTSGTPPVAGAAATAASPPRAAAILSRHCSRPPLRHDPAPPRSCIRARPSPGGSGRRPARVSTHLVLTRVRHALGGDARLAPRRSRGLRHPRIWNTYRSRRGGSISVMSQVVC